jgi:hypothetical protein
MDVPNITLSPGLSTLEYALYVVGWLVWIPTYVVALLWIYKPKAGQPRRCNIPTIAVCANVAFEGWWFFFGDFSDAQIIRWVYLGAFLLDVPILIGTLIYGSFGAPRRFGPDNELIPATSPGDRLQHYVVVVATFLAWLLAFIALRFSYEVPLGSVGAYLDNFVMSALFVWVAWLDPQARQSKWTAWSKFLGTFFVTIMVALRYNGLRYSFLYFLAACSAVLDVWYVWVVHHPRSEEDIKTGFLNATEKQNKKNSWAEMA